MSGVPSAFAAGARAGLVAAGRYLVYSAGRECGEERWTLAGGPEGYVLTGEQVTVPPHPFPSRHEYRATLTREWRLTGLEIVWTVGERVVRSTHAAGDGRWRVQIEYGGTVREQEGDFPPSCEVESISHPFNTVILARREFAVGGEHEFPALRIGPPLMAVTPERMLLRCTGEGAVETPFGAVPARRYVVSLPPRPEAEGYAFWADEQGFVLESYEGLDPSHPWMRLVEYRRG